MSWFKSQIWEIKQSHALKYFAIVLGLSQILSYFFWQDNNVGIFNHGANNQPICWPFFSNCHDFVQLTAEQFQILLKTYLTISVLSCLFFVLTRAYSVGWVLLMLSFAIKLGIYLIDFTAYNNIETLLLILSICFLFVPNKENVTRMFIIAYYMYKSFYKFNSHWLSGQALTKYFNFDSSSLTLIAGLSLVVTAIAPWCMLSKNLKTMMFAILSLLMYQYFEWALLENHFETTMMILFLFYFAFIYFDDKRREFEHEYQSYLYPTPSRFWMPFTLAIFIYIQKLPDFDYWPYQDTPFRLTQAQAVHDCDSFTYLIKKNSIEDISTDLKASLSNELKCHAYIYFRTLKNICVSQKNDASFVNIASFFNILGAENDKPLINTYKFCDESSKYYGK